MTIETQKVFYIASRAEPLIAVERPAATIAPLRPGQGLKRALDLVIVLAALPFLLPLLLGLVGMVKLSSPGPVLYGHKRVGRGGRSFRCWKFRTMVTNGDAVLADHLRRHPAARKLWEAERKLHDDPRVTPVGAVLRKLSLDELPQLLNVLSGEMSLVGPRPVVTDELEKYGRSSRHYLSVRPGLTGLWQVSGRSDTSYRRRVVLDRSYVTRWSLLLDLRVLVMTIPAVLRSHGAR